MFTLSSDKDQRENSLSSHVKNLQKEIRNGLQFCIYFITCTSLNVNGIADFIFSFLPPVMKLRQGSVFTPVCQSFCSRGGQTHPPGRHPPLGRHPPPGRYLPGQTLPPGSHPYLGRHPPCPVHGGVHPLPHAQCMLRYGQQAGVTHPTGMHTCCRYD